MPSSFFALRRFHAFFPPTKTTNFFGGLYGKTESIKFFGYGKNIEIDVEILYSLRMPTAKDKRRTAVPKRVEIQQGGAWNAIASKWVRRRGNASDKTTAVPIGKERQRGGSPQSATPHRRFSTFERGDLEEKTDR